MKLHISESEISLESVYAWHTAYPIVPVDYYDPRGSVPPKSPCSGVPTNEQVCCEVPVQPTSQAHSEDRILQLPIFSEEPAE